MKQTFTASEVRERAKTFGAGDIYHMLCAYADRLEADERAVPVYQHRSKNGPMLRWFDCSEETFMAMEHSEHDREHFDRRILYTHPSPADAERLAEALHMISLVHSDCARNDTEKMEAMCRIARGALSERVTQERSLGSSQNE